jgi:hypothetical protein
MHKELKVKNVTRNKHLGQRSSRVAQFDPVARYTEHSSEPFYSIQGK